MRKTSIKNSLLSAESFLLPAVFLYFLLLTFFLKTIFILKNWSFLRPDGLGELVKALFIGMRFEHFHSGILLYSRCFSVQLLLLKKTRLTEWIFEGYFIAVAFLSWFFGLRTFSILKRPGNILPMRPLPISGPCCRPLFRGLQAAPCVVLAFNALQSCFSLPDRSHNKVAHKKICSSGKEAILFLFSCYIHNYAGADDCCSARRTPKPQPETR